jgi:hypothetical protein
MKASFACVVLLTLGAFCPSSGKADVSQGQGEGEIVTGAKELSAPSSPLMRQDAQNGGKGQEEPVDQFRPRTHFRLGAVLSPEVNFAAGLDFPLSNVRLGRDFEGRLDIEALLVNFKNKSGLFGSGSGTSLYIPITLNQVYVGGLRRGGKVYGGFGIGTVLDVNIFVEKPGSFTGKLFVGAQFNARTSAELGVNFIGKDAIATFQIRLGL